MPDRHYRSDLTGAAQEGQPVGSGRPRISESCYLKRVVQHEAPIAPAVTPATNATPSNTGHTTRRRHRQRRSPSRFFALRQRRRPLTHRHIGSVVLLTKTSRTHVTTSFHNPVSKAMPTTTRSTPPKSLNSPRVSTKPAQRLNCAPGCDCQQHKRDAQPETVGDYKQKRHEIQLAPPRWQRPLL